MGRTPAPTALKVVRGERPDRINTQEPRPGGEVTPPSWLSEDSRRVWAQFAPDLIAKQVMTAWDPEAFAGYCDAVVRRARAADRLDAEGEVVDAPVYGRNGELTGHRAQKNQWLGVWKDANDVILRFGARFGMTPSDRSQLKVGDGSSSNPKDRLLSG